MTARSFARLALAATLSCVAGAVLADGIEISGTASMGLTGGSAGPAPGTVRLITDLDLQMRLSHTTDGGLTFAVEIDLDALDTSSPAPSPSAIPRRR
ncbi:porin [Roseicyclus mahoneyensis]|uniref:Porin-like protein n=1 Tax=Roseicyclus mahoneyensis TaxID=164332 RepID=A0A316GTE0_9RHOB|nr:porin [Roseicyclus mahoneyensis]PWK62856.1 porin-like protein [Roseicyclus mahoneyensis]